MRKREGQRGGEEKQRESWEVPVFLFLLHSWKKKAIDGDGH